MNHFQNEYPFNLCVTSTCCVCFLQKDSTFEFPDIFNKKKAPSEKTTEKYKKMMQGLKKDEQKQWDVRDLPPWFR